MQNSRNYTNKNGIHVALLEHPPVEIFLAKDFAKEYQISTNRNRSKEEPNDFYPEVLDFRGCRVYLAVEKGGRSLLVYGIDKLRDVYRKMHNRTFKHIFGMPEFHPLHSRYEEFFSTPTEVLVYHVMDDNRMYEMVLPILENSKEKITVTGDIHLVEKYQE